MVGETIEREIPIFFRNDVDKIEPSYSSNRDNLQALDSLFRSLHSDSTLTLVDVNLAGWASPPATAGYNVNLSQRRANVVADWLSSNCAVASDSVRVTYYGVNYPLLRRLVNERGYEYAGEVTAIIDAQPQPGHADNRQPRLKHLRDGRVWRELSRDYFPELRRTDVVVSYNRVEPVALPVVEESPIIDTCEMVPAVEVAPVVDTIAPASRPNVYLSLHTNMLHDVLAIPNLGAEIYLGKNFSVAGNWWYAWWKTDRRHRYWRTYGGYLAGRYWLGEAAHAKPLTGHHVGVYAEALLYDFEWGGTGYLSGVPGKNIFHQPTWGGGIEYGFALPIGSRLNIDFTIGLGYLNTRYWEYEPQDDHYVWLSRHKRGWWGPTKAEVSLVWLLGRGNVNRKKGGGR